MGAVMARVFAILLLAALLAPSLSGCLAGFVSQPQVGHACCRHGAKPADCCKLDRIPSSTSRATVLVQKDALADFRLLVVEEHAWLPISPLDSYHPVTGLSRNLVLENHFFRL